jgi:hypothetical protein
MPVEDRAISVNVSSVSGAKASPLYCACDWPSNTCSSASTPAGLAVGQQGE